VVVVGQFEIRGRKLVMETLHGGTMQPQLLYMEVDRMVQVTEEQWVLQEGNSLRLKAKAGVLLEKLVRENQ